MTHKKVIEFIIEHINHGFGILQTLSTNKMTSFMSEEVHEYAKSYKIKLLKSSTYYAQDNGQTESSNKTLISNIKKKVRDYPKCGHKVLSKALCAHRIFGHRATKVSPFELVHA
jgi:hypothetical protein